VRVRSFAGALCAAVLLGLALAGCGSESGSSEQPTTTIDHPCPDGMTLDTQPDGTTPRTSTFGDKTLYTCSGVVTNETRTITTP
jgi:hypothetical protein